MGEAEYDKNSGPGKTLGGNARLEFLRHFLKTVLLHVCTYVRCNFILALSFRPNLSIKMGGMDRCDILFYAGSTTTDIGLLLVAPAPPLLPHETFSI
jgi:hypothetical protein